MIRRFTKLVIYESLYNETGYYVVGEFLNEDCSTCGEVLASGFDNFIDAKDMAFTIRYVQSRILNDVWLIPVIDEDGTEYC